MNLYLKISVLLSVLFVLGCSSKLGQTGISSSIPVNTADATVSEGIQAQPLSIFTYLSHGTYSCECQVDPRNTRSWITSFSVSKDSIRQITKTFASPNCQNQDELVEYDISPVELASTFETDIYLFKFQITKIELTPYSNGNTRKLNTLQFAGFKDWKTEETKELYIEILTDLEKSYFKIGDINYFHVKLENQDMFVTTEIEDFNSAGKVIKYSYQPDL